MSLIVGGSVVTAHPSPVMAVAFVREWKVSTPVFGENAPVGLVVDEAGQIYITDIGNSRVQVFDSSGGFLWMWGEAGTLPGQFDDPMSIAIGQDGLIYVTDFQNLRVQVFSPAVAVRPTSWTQVKLLPSPR